MNVVRSMALWVLALATTACAGSVPPVTLEMAQETGVAIAEQPLQTMASGWNVTGSARILQVAGARGLFAQVEADGLTPGSHSWAIYEGTCMSEGAVLGTWSTDPAGSGAALDANSEGEASGLGMIPAGVLTADQISSSDVSIRVFNGAGAMQGRAVACATL